MTDLFTRRRFLAAFCYALALVLSGVALIRLWRVYRQGYDAETLWVKVLSRLQSDAPLSQEQVADLNRYIDLLVPEDNESPGALSLGIDQLILARCASDHAYRQQLREGLIQLQRLVAARHQHPFALLSNTDAEALISLSEQAKPKRLEHRLFQQLRSDVMTLYYSRPDSWRSLDYAGPPQPAGFLDYAQPRQRSSTWPTQ